MIQTIIIMVIVTALMVYILYLKGRLGAKQILLDRNNEYINELSQRKDNTPDIMYVLMARWNNPKAMASCYGVFLSFDEASAEVSESEIDFALVMVKIDSLYPLTIENPCYDSILERWLWHYSVVTHNGSHQEAIDYLMKRK